MSETSLAAASNCDDDWVLVKETDVLDDWVEVPPSGTSDNSPEPTPDPTSVPVSSNKPLHREISDHTFGVMSAFALVAKSWGIMLDDEWF